MIRSITRFVSSATTNIPWEGQGLFVVADGLTVRLIINCTYRNHLQCHGITYGLLQCQVKGEHNETAVYSTETVAVLIYRMAQPSLAK